MGTWSYSGLSFGGPYSYMSMLSHSGTSHSGTSHSGTSHSGTSYAGPPLSPMMSAGINIARDDLNTGLMPQATLGAAGDVAQGLEWGNAGLPLPNQATYLHRWAPEVRASLAEFELVSRLAFRCTTATGAATLYHLEMAKDQRESIPALVSAIPIVTLVRPSRAFFLEQLRLVESHASSRDTRAPEILTQMEPPMSYFAAIGNLHSQRTPKTLQLLALAQHFAYVVDMRFKHALACPRPVEYSAFIQPMIETPAHGSFPAGHAVESYLCAEVMQQLIPGFAPGSNPGKALRRQAQRIAENRVVAGLHFPVDCMAGRVLGDALAQYFVAMCTKASPSQGQWTDATFDVHTNPPAAPEPSPDDPAITSTLDEATAKALGCSKGSAQERSLQPIPELAELWKGAKEEWLY